MSALNRVPQRLQNSLSIDCKEMKLVNGSDDTSYVGPGVVRLSKKGVLECKIFAHSNSIAYAYGSSDELPKSGSMYTDCDYYSLSATAYDKSVWTTERLIPSIDSSFSAPDEVVIRSRLAYVQSTFVEAKGKPSVIEVFICFQKETEWRALLGEWEFGAPYTGYKFLITSAVNEHISIRVETNSIFPEGIIMKLMESFSFLLGETLRYSAYRISSSGVGQIALQTIAQETPLRQRYSPIDLRNPNMQASAQSMFKSYFSYINTKELDELWHTATAHLSNARQASNNSLDAWGVGVCVALEGISALLPFKIEDDDLHEIERIQDAVRVLVKEIKIAENIGARVTGLIGQLKNVRVKDRLAPLLAGGKINGSYMKAWEATRHKAVHTAQMTAKDFSAPSLQIAITNILKVQTLINQLVFILIRYDGPFVDYGSLGFPTKQM